jgi:hypothetical protein
MGRTWYCLLNGCEIGPLTSSGLSQLAANGQLEPQDLIRNAAEPDWHPARHLKGLEFSRPPQRAEELPVGWYFRDGAVVFGPHSSAELIALGALGVLRPVDYLRRGNNGDWIRADRVKGLRLRPDDPSEQPDRREQRDPSVLFDKPVSPGLSDSALAGKADVAGKSDLALKAEVAEKPLASAKPTAAARSDVPARPDLPAKPEADKPDAGPKGNSPVPTSVDDELPALGDSAVDDEFDEPEDSDETGSSSGGEPLAAVETARAPQSAEPPEDGAKQAAAQRPGRVAKSVGTNRSQLSDALLGLFVILPCILPAFGPPAGGWTGTLVALAACAVGVALFYQRWRPLRPEYYWGAAAATFMAIFGVTTLLEFTDFSRALATGSVRWNFAPLWLVREVGSAYQAAATGATAAKPGNFAELIGPTILSVGLFEEALKLLPAVIAFASQQVSRQAGLLFIGAASGLAFGIAEGAWMLSHFRGELTLSHLIVRLVGGAACHAVMTSLAVLLFLAIRKRVAAQSQVALELLVGVAAAAAIACLHGVYDTLLAVNLRQAAGVLMAVMVLALLTLDRSADAPVNSSHALA